MILQFLYQPYGKESSITYVQQIALLMHIY